MSAVLQKEYLAPTSATSGLQPYGTKYRTWTDRLRERLRQQRARIIARSTVRKHLLAELRKFEEELHPRAEDGKFTSGGSAEAKADSLSTERYSKVNGQWVNAKGESAPEAIASRLSQLKVPPGWRDVQVSTDPSARLLAKGKDAKDREVRIYSREHSEAAAAEKFARLKEFNEQAPKVAEAARAGMLNTQASEQARDTAASLYLITQSGMRPGSDKDTKAEKKAYGASNLRTSHVTVDGDKVTFNFTGKKGVEQEQSVHDRDLARYVAAKLEAAKGADQRLFNTTPEALRDLVKRTAGEQFKTKDLRTWVGTSTALRELRQYELPTNKKGYEKLRREVATKVAQRLGNTPAMALKAYIDPAVWHEPAGALHKRDVSDQELMDEFFETTLYDDVGDWRALDNGEGDDELEKGDAPGHDFHGNQWTTGRDGGQLLETTAPSGKKAGMKVGADGKVHSVFVPEADRGKGLGAQLYRMAAERLHSQGKQLQSGDINEDSRRVWESAVRRGEAERTDHGYRMKKVEGVAALLKRALSVDHAAHEAATSPFNLRTQPTAAQQSAGNYKKGRLRLGGMDIAIENPAGSHRRPEWPAMTHHYGYIKRTEGADGDHVDVFVRVGTPANWSGPVYVIDQYIANRFDEHKCMIGWDDEATARQAYLQNYQPGWKGLGSITRMSLDTFRAWLAKGKTRAPLVKHDVRALLLNRLAAGNYPSKQES